MITKNNMWDVMDFFFKYPERKFHLRELERLTGLSMPGVRKITGKLAKEGLLKTEKEKMVKNYYATRESKFLHLKQAYNIYSVFSSGLLDHLIKAYSEPEAVVLFGSYSKGEDISKSDIDIAIITSEHHEPDLTIFERKLARKIMIYEIQMKKAEKEFINTLSNGIVLHGYLKVI
jgi:predicted nucleotidyltransferase